MPVNPSYSGGRHQEDCGSKPAVANSSRDSVLKIPNTKLQVIEYLPIKCEAHSSNPSTTQKNPDQLVSSMDKEKIPTNQVKNAQVKKKNRKTVTF
jgi:hypothetical protein